MNILYLCDEFPPYFRGGLGTYAIEMTWRFVNAGENVVVFARNPDNKAVTRDLLRGVEVHRPQTVDATDILPTMIPQDVRMWPPAAQKFFAETLMYNILTSTKVVNQLVAREGRKFDLIVAHDWLASLSGIMLKKELKLPLVVHFHSTEHGRSGGTGSPTIKEIERLAALTADRIVTVSYAMRDELIGLGYPEGKIRVVYNAVDEKKYDPNRVKKSDVEQLREKLGIGSDPMIFFVGRLSWVKGADSLVQAMPIILREVPDAKLVIVGRGEQEGMLADMVRRFGIEKSVRLKYEYVPEEQRILYYAACDVAVFPSRYEPFGIVCTEAMAMGKPVVVGAKGTSGLREQVIPYDMPQAKRCGSHVDPDNPYDIAKFTIELLKDKRLREELGRNARERVLERFTLERTASDTLSVYRDVVSGR
ncbi:MAG: glycosyltransferase family 4 protein [Candidatus Hadarchaeales archaeon]